jgi:hypothetical protein
VKRFKTNITLGLWIPQVITGYKISNWFNEQVHFTECLHKGILLCFPHSLLVVKEILSFLVKTQCNDFVITFKT